MTAATTGQQQVAQERASPKKAQQCRSAEKAIVYYRNKVWKYQDFFNDPRNPTYFPERKKNACPYKRYVAHNWQGIAYAYRVQYIYHYAWWKWMPYEWRARSKCELGYSLQPKSWRSDVRNYVGRFQGFVNFYYPSSWDGYIKHANPDAGPYPADAILATPRQQFEVALAIVKVEGGTRPWGSCG